MTNIPHVQSMNTYGVLQHVHLLYYIKYVLHGLRSLELKARPSKDYLNCDADDAHNEVHARSQCLLVIMHMHEVHACSRWSSLDRENSLSCRSAS